MGRKDSSNIKWWLAVAITVLVPMVGGPLIFFFVVDPRSGASMVGALICVADLWLFFMWHHLNSDPWGRRRQRRQYTRVVALVLLILAAGVFLILWGFRMIYS